MRISVRLLNGNAFIFERLLFLFKANQFFNQKLIHRTTSYLDEAPKSIICVIPGRNVGTFCLLPDGGHSFPLSDR